jgi:hypothetical protein
MALQFRRYENAQVFAFDFGGSSAPPRSRWAATGTISAALSDEATTPSLAAARVASTTFRARVGHGMDRSQSWRGKSRDLTGGQGSSLVGADLACLGTDPGTHFDRAVGPAAIERSEAGAATLLSGRCLWPAARRRDSSASAKPQCRRSRPKGLIGTGAAPAVSPISSIASKDRLDGRPTLLIVDEGWLASTTRISPAAPRMAEDAAQEERLRHLRHPVAFGHRWLGDRAGDHRELPNALLLPNERAIEPQIAAIYRRFGLNDRQIEILSRATPKRDYYCQSRRGNRLFELGLSEVALALLRRVFQDRPGRYRAARGRAWPRRLPAGLAAASRCRLGRRPHPEPQCQSGEIAMRRLAPRSRCAAAGTIALSPLASRRPRGVDRL